MVMGQRHVLVLALGLWCIVALPLHEETIVLLQEVGDGVTEGVVATLDREDQRDEQALEDAEANADSANKSIKNHALADNINSKENEGSQMVQEQTKVKIDTEKIKLAKDEQDAQARFDKAKAAALAAQGSATMEAEASSRRS
jgi:hypothetical protein